MGSGKSSVGRTLSEVSGRPFQDTDLMLQNKLGRSIPQIFQIYGEDAFREHETSILRALEPSEIVLATGGGIVCREENWAELRRLGTIVYLRASLQTLYERLDSSKKKRPLLADDSWRERLRTLLEARNGFYEQADRVVEVDEKSLEEVAEAILRALGGTP